MPSILRLLQRMQRTLGLWLRPGEPPMDVRDTNLPVKPLVTKVEFLPGQLPQSDVHSHEDSLRRWRERQQQSRAGPWQQK